MKHFCGANGCRLVTDEEYERLTKDDTTKDENLKKTKKTTQKNA